MSIRVAHAVDAHRKPTTHGIAQAESTTPGAYSSRPPKLKALLLLGGSLSANTLALALP